MTCLQSHQAKIEVFEFWKKSFSMALPTSWGIQKCIFRTLGLSDKWAVEAFFKHFWHAQNDRTSPSWKHVFFQHDFENQNDFFGKNCINIKDWSCSELPLNQIWWHLVNIHDQETTSYLFGRIWLFVEKWCLANIDLNFFLSTSQCWCFSFWHPKR